MNYSCLRFLKALAVGVAAGLLVPVKVPAQAPTIIYSDLLLNGFQDWSWGTRNFANTSPVHSGSESISASLTAWEAISFYHADLNANDYSSLSFWANGGANGGQRLQVYAEYGANSGPAVQIPALPANTWTQIVVTLGALGVATVTNLNRFDLQLTSSGTTGDFYLDDVQLDAKPAPALVHLTANRAQALRTADFRWAAVNTAIWDGDFDTATTIALMQEMGVKLLRAPGGSVSDDYHWESNTTDANSWTGQPRSRAWCMWRPTWGRRPSSRSITAAAPQTKRRRGWLTPTVGRPIRCHWELILPG